MLNPILWRHHNKGLKFYLTPFSLIKVSVNFFILLFLPVPSFGFMPTLFETQDKHPVEITSDNANFDEKTGNVTYQGHVHALQGESELWSDTLVIHRTSEGKIDYIVAQGSPAEFITPAQSSPKSGIKGKASLIHYYPNEEKIIFSQNAELIQDDRLIRAAHLIYFIKLKTLISESALDSKTMVIFKPSEKARR